MCVSLDLESIFKKWINKYQQVIYSSWFVPISSTYRKMDWSMQCQGKKIPGRRSFWNYIPSLNTLFRYMTGNVRRRIRCHWYRDRQCMDNYCSQSLCTGCRISRDCRPPRPPPLSNKKSEQHVLLKHFIFGFDHNYWYLQFLRAFWRKFNKRKKMGG